MATAREHDDRRDIFGRNFLFAFLSVCLYARCKFVYIVMFVEKLLRDYMTRSHPRCHSNCEREMFLAFCIGVSKRIRKCRLQIGD